MGRVVRRDEDGGGKGSREEWAVRGVERSGGR